MIKIVLNKDRTLNNIEYSHYGKKYIGKDDLPIIKSDLKLLNKKLREYQNLYNIFASDEQLEDEILYAQLKYISNIEIIGNIERPKEFRFYITTHYITIDVFTSERYENEEKNKIEKEKLYFERMSLEEFGYYLSWRTKIINHEPIDCEEDLIILLKREFICGTIDNSKDMLDYLRTALGPECFYFSRFYHDLSLINFGMSSYIEDKYRKAKDEPWDHFVIIHEFYCGNYYYKTHWTNLCEYLRMGTKFSLSGSYYKKYSDYHLKEIFIEIFNTAIPKVAIWLNSKGIPFAECFVAEKKQRELFSRYVSEEFINRIYDPQELIFEYSETWEVHEHRKLLFLLIDNGIRKFSHFRVTNEDYLNICSRFKRVSKFIDDKLCKELVEYADSLIVETVLAKYKTVFDAIIVEQMKIEQNRMPIHRSEEIIKKQTPKEQFLEGVASECAFDNAISIYNRLTPSGKKASRGLFYTVIFGLWVLEADISYVELIKILEFDKNNLVNKNALINLDSTAFLEYVLRNKKVYTNVLTKKTDEDHINTYTVLSYYLFYLICIHNGANPIDLLLGKKVTEEWPIFGDYLNIDLLNERKLTVRKRVLELEEYHVEIDNGVILSKVTRPAETKLSETIIKYINASIQKRIFELLHVSVTKTLKESLDDYKACIVSNSDTIGDLMDKYTKELNTLLELLLIYNTSIDTIALSSILKNNSVFEVSKKHNENYTETIFNVFYDVSSTQISKSTHLDVIWIDYNKRFEDYFIKGPKETKRIVFKKQNLKYFYDNVHKTISQLETIFRMKENYYDGFDFSKCDFSEEIKTFVNGIDRYLKQISQNNTAFQQWILRIKNGEIIIPKNQTYIYLLYAYLINRFSVTQKGNKWNLLVLISFWNNVYKGIELDEQALYYLELTFDYFIAYCPDMTITEFKSLFCYEFIFEGEKGFPAKADVNIEDGKELYSSDVIKFYNSIMDYKFLSTTANKVNTKYKLLLEKSLKLVGEKMKILWEKYNKDFNECLFPTEILEERNKILFPKIGLTHDTKMWLRNNDNYNCSCFENVGCYYSYYSNNIEIYYDCYIYSYPKIILEYIFKSTEQSLRTLLNMESNFTLDTEKLIEKYNEQLFIDNHNEDTIGKAIYSAVFQTIKDNADLAESIVVSIPSRNLNVTDKASEGNRASYLNIVYENELENVNDESLMEAKNILTINQNKLVIDEEDENESANDFAGTNSQEQKFSQKEIEFLSMLVNNDKARLSEVYGFNGFLNQQIEKINEKALFLIDDAVIDVNTISIYEEYIDIVKRWLKNEYD